jgi:hypothetical protein
MKSVFLLLLLVPVFAFADPLYSPTWGFSLDLPEGYRFIEGNGKDRFSFAGPGGIRFDLLVYDGIYKTQEELIDDVYRRLQNRGDADFFRYHNRQAAVLELDFAESAGWGLCVELGYSTGDSPPMLLALSYSPVDGNTPELFHLSALDSIVPSGEDRYYPGPITEYSYPRGEARRRKLAGSGITAMIRENDAEASQVLIEREFRVLENYLSSEHWREAWIRYYRLIYRDSRDRIADAAAALVRNWKTDRYGSDEAKRELAQKVLTFVQGFRYERNPEGSDFVNLVSAVTEGRGDCDSRAMLWAVILANADIRSAIMVSRQYGHAMGLAELTGTGARFEAGGTEWLVAETTANVDIGLIAQDVSDAALWLGIVFE